MQTGLGSGGVSRSSDTAWTKEMLRGRVRPSGPHRIEVWSPDGLTRPRNISFVQAVSLELETPPEPSPVCINGRRYEAASGRPVETDADAGSVAIENCGDVPLFVDWVQSLPS